MSQTTDTGLLLEATDIAKTYGAVVALKSASLAVRPEGAWPTCTTTGIPRSPAAVRAPSSRTSSGP